MADLTGHYTEGLQRFDIRRFWHSFVERIWIVAICVLAGFFLALGYLARTPKLYQGHSVLEVEFQEPSFLPTDDSTTRMRSMFLASQEALRTIEQNLTNQTLLSRVVRSEGLAADGGRALLGQTVVIGKKSSPPQDTETPQHRMPDGRKCNQCPYLAIRQNSLLEDAQPTVPSLDLVAFDPVIEPASFSLVASITTQDRSTEAIPISVTLLDLSTSLVR